MVKTAGLRNAGFSPFLRMPSQISRRQSAYHRLLVMVVYVLMSKISQKSLLSCMIISEKNIMFFSLPPKSKVVFFCDESYLLDLVSVRL